MFVRMLVLALLLHGFAAITSAGDGLVFAGPKPQSSSSKSLITSSTSSTASIAATPTATPTAIDCANVKTYIDASCWDLLNMTQWMFNWNLTTDTCNKTEIWSNCFLREAYGTSGNDCSRLGSASCPAPLVGYPPHDAHAFYGAYNIYAVEQYLSVWQTAIYAIGSQPAINNVVSTLSGLGNTLTVGALLASIVQNFGLDEAVDEAFISILPSGAKSTPLDVNAEYMSTQLGALLAEILLDLSTNFFNGYFLFLAQHGQMMTYTGESLQKLQSSLANVVPTGALIAELGPISNRRRNFVSEIKP